MKKVQIHRSDAAINTDGATGVVYSAADVKGMFVDAVSHGKLRNTKILGYQTGGPDGQVQAVTRDSRTGVVTVYAMDMETGIPYPAHVRQRRGRRVSRDFKLIIAEERWHER